MIYRLFASFDTWYRRDGRIRTCGLHIPNVARYRATLHPVWVCKGIINLYNRKYYLKNFYVVKDFRLRFFNTNN